MPSIARAILLAVHVSFFLALTGFSPATISALASPLPDHSPAVSSNSPSSLLAVRVLSKHTDAELAARTPAVSPAASAPVQQGKSFESLHQSSEKTAKAANHMQELAARSKSVDPNNEAFRQECVQGMNDYTTSFREFQTSFVPAITSDKGLANYDPTSPLQVIVKIVVNAHKDLLSAVTALVYNLPILGPILGPIVYQIKCIVDALLDATEDLTDAILNIIAPLLQALGLGSLLPLLQDLGLIGATQ
ncbi:hypothetical protein B0H11DRAFT_2014096 [Mycena galericulata]|nr:hypothetical protein B0H11DRAFT_2014096 [Mycena galericulata]